MKFIKLTNANPDNLGDPIYLNKDWIISVYTAPSQRGGSLVTYVFGGSTGLSWAVEETANEVISLINETE